MVCKPNEKIKFIIATSYESTVNLKRNAVKTDNRNNRNTTVVKYGLKIDEQYHLNSIIKQSNFSDQWYDDYHSFVLSWTADKVVFEIDGQSNNLEAIKDLPLNILLDSEVKRLIRLCSTLFLIISIPLCSVLYIHRCVSRRYDSFP